MSALDGRPSADAMRAWLRGAFEAAIAVADPTRIVPAYLPTPPDGRVVVVGAGKAAAAMAFAVDRAWPQVRLDGLVVTRYGHGMAAPRVSVLEASHPVPDAAGVYAARQILAQVQRTGEDDLVLVLISGGASSLLALPVESVPMPDLKAVTQALLRSGADIREMNCVRKHLSRIAGGRLAQACPARILTLMISDVPGDDPSVIGSGPTVPDPTTFADALAVLGRYGITAPDSVRAHLEAGIARAAEETPKPGDPCFARVDNQVIATAGTMLEAGRTYFEDAGYEVDALGELEGEAGDVARAHAERIHRRLQAGPTAGGRGFVLLSGGECTVTVRGKGRGGRCSEYLLHLQMALDALGIAPRVAAIACDTDGIDGSEDNAGAMLLHDSSARATSAGIDAREFAANNDAWGYFDALGDLVVTGPTRTNVNDFRAVVVNAS